MNLPKIVAAGVIAMSMPLLAGTAVAAPLSQSLALKAANAATIQPEAVQWRRRAWRGGYWGGGRWVGPAIVGGAILGGALAAGAYGPYGPYYGYGPYYRGYAYGPDHDAIAYCQQRFRSYDVRSGTYLGYDGRRHPCP